MLECPNCHFDNPENTKFCGNCATPLPILDETLESLTETFVVTRYEIKTGSLISDRYEIIEEIGKGGMGKVYKALDRDVDEKIALKLIRPEIAFNEKIIERFRNEMKMARKITHKNVCRMFDIGRDEELKYITMEYVSGEDLKKSIRRMGPLTLRKTLSISKQICQGLSEAHDLGIVHRDLKPHNIMIDKEGNTKIMDFGIALSEEGKGITDPNVMVGTPQYLSPEQVEGRNVDKRSDIYSLGVIIFEMVTGQVPFDGDSTVSIAVKHKTEDPPNPREINTQIPFELSQLILKCMEKDPNKRIQTANELCTELATIEDKIPTKEAAISRKKFRADMSRFPLKTKYILGSILAFVVISLTGYFVYNHLIKKEIRITEQLGANKWASSIVVLPFTDLSPEKDQEPLYLLITDTLIVNLHNFRELRVISTLSAQMYQDSKKGIKEIGEELNVDYVLQGTLLRSEENLRVTVQLISVKTESIVWAEIFERSQPELGHLQEELAKATAIALGIERVDQRYEVASVKESSSLMANKFYSRARHFEISMYHTKSERDFNICVQNYLKVIDSFPNDAMTYWRLGIVHEQRFHHTLDEKYLDLMFQYFQNSYEIDPDFAEANIGLGWSYFYQQDNDNAFRYFNRAYQLDPYNAEVNFHLGSFYTSIGLWEPGLTYYSKAIELDPMPLNFVILYNLQAKCYSFLGRFEEAVDHIEKAIEIQPDLKFYLTYTLQLIMLKRLDEAVTQVSIMERLNPDSKVVRHYRALLFAAKGDKSKALSLVQDEEEKYTYVMTNIFSLLGMKDEAIENIELGIDISFKNKQSYYYPHDYLRNNPCLDVLRDDPRFVEILRKEEKKHQERFSKYSNL